MTLRFLSVLFLVIMSIAYNANSQWTYDTLNFEASSDALIIDTSGNSVWQIGHPQKIFFYDSHDGINVIVTDTVNSYPANDTSSFIYVIRNPYTQTCQTCLYFWHKYDMDTLLDKGLIDASYDGGSSWVALKDTNNFYPWMSYFYWQGDYQESTGVTTGHNLISTGKSDGWIQSGFCWQWFTPVKNIDTIIVNPDSLMLRFTFISDSVNNNREGWMIDEITVSSAGPEICSGTDFIGSDNDITLFPNPFTSSVTLKSSDFLDNVTLTFFNSYGQVVKKNAGVSGYEYVISRDDLPDGLYFLQLSDENKYICIFKIYIIN